MKQTKDKPAKNWLVAITGCVMLLFSGVPSAWGIFRKEVCEQYSFTEESSAFVLNVTVAAFGIGCVIGGYLQDKKGSFLVSIMGSILLSSGFGIAAILPENNIWLFYLGFCIPAGLGCAFLYPAVMSCIQKCNPNHKGFATGIAGLGFGLSGLVLTVIKLFTVKLWGVRGSFLFLAASIAILCTAGSFLMKCPPMKDSNAKKEDVTPRQLIKTKAYWWLTLAVFFTAPAVLLFSPKIVEMAQERNLAPEIAVWIVAFGGALNAAGRLLLPALSDKWGRKPTAIGGILLLGLVSVGFAFAQSWLVFLGYGVLCFFYSGVSALLPSFCTDLFGTRWAGANYGLVALGMTAGSLLLPPLVGALGGKTLAHWVAVLCCGLAAFCYFRVPMNQQKNQHFL